MPKSKYVSYYENNGIYWSGARNRSWPTGTSQILESAIRGKHTIHQSQGNPYHLLGKSQGAIGGNFLVIKQTADVFSTPTGHFSNATGNPFQQNAMHYIGKFAPRVSASPFWPEVTPSSNSELDALGATAIANVLPTNPLSGLTLALSELKREGVPSLFGIQSWKNKTRVARSAGDEYLNHQFGWLPLVSDIKSFTHSVRNSDELLAQYERNSGRRIKRNLTLEFSLGAPTTSEAVALLDPAIDVVGVFMDGKHPRTRYISDVTKSHVKFTACFTYYLPPFNPTGDNGKRNEQLANYLYGTRPTPETVWNLAPWSWAADWVGNFGDVIHNVSAFHNDGLVMNYGYVTEYKTREVTYSYPHLNFSCYPGQRMPISTILRTTSIKRRVATPYGFGLDIGGFTDRQWSILAALGISKGSRQL